MGAAASLNEAECPASLKQKQPIGEVKHETSLITGWFCRICSSTARKTAHNQSLQKCPNMQLHLFECSHIPQITGQNGILKYLNYWFQVKTTCNWKPKIRPFNLKRIFDILILVSFIITITFFPSKDDIAHNWQRHFTCPHGLWTSKTSSLCNRRSCQ